MKIKYYWKLLRGKTKALKPASLSFANIKAVIQAWWRKRRMQIDGFELEQHIFEQIIWRRTRVIEISPLCWSEGVCNVCGCEILGKTMEDRPCSANDVALPQCYPAMMNKKEWEQYKLDNKIKLFL